MSPAATAAAPAHPYTTLGRCASICSLLELLSGPALRDAFLEVDARSRGGHGREQYQLPVGPRGEFVDPAILKLLEEGEDWAAYVHLATRERGASGQPVRLGALMVSETLPLSERDDYRPTLPTAAIAETASRFCGHRIAPSAVVVGGARTQGAGIVVTGLYALTNPLDVSTDVAQQEALDLMRRLAYTVVADGIETGVTLADLHVPMPGTAVRELPFHHQLEVTLLWSDRRYAIEDLRAFLQES